MSKEKIILKAILANTNAIMKHLKINAIKSAEKPVKAIIKSSKSAKKPTKKNNRLTKPTF